MLSLLLGLQVLAGDSTYASRGLRDLVAAAAIANRVVPQSLAAYNARAETEVAILLRTVKEQENVMQLEQFHSDVRWDRSGSVNQHVVGYRTRNFAMTISAMTMLRQPWIVPVLYGNRLRLLFGEAGTERDPADPDAMIAVHPLAGDRDAVYRFEGGDTVMVLQIDQRTIPVIRVQVTPRAMPKAHMLLFRGELDIDAVRKHVIRMRGEFLVQRPHASLLTRAVLTGLTPLLFAELVNAEVAAEYWLPSYQRVEMQVRSPLASEYRPVLRVITRFRDYALNADARPGERSAVAGRLSLAPADSVSRFSAWMSEIGAATTTVRASDFDDVTPDEWSTRGAPRLDWHAERLSDVLRTNRVEGVYTGLAAKLRMRDAAPGLSFGGYAGWAWAEEVPRGSFSVESVRDPWRFSLRTQRALANTNDFLPPLEEETPAFAALVTKDDYDYVDRTSTTLSVTRTLGGERGSLLRLEMGPAEDEPEIARLRYGLVHGRTAFRPNRYSVEGRYFRSLVGFEFHPDVSGQYLEPGVGAGVSYERGDGELQWQRIEARLVGRHSWGPLVYGARFDGAAVLGRNLPPQQLIEFGENEGLPGYTYKEFGGDRAALLRLSAAYQLPWLSSPIRVGRWLYLPSLSPSVSVGVQSGWAGASLATQSVLAGFGRMTSPETQYLAVDPGEGQPLPATRPSGRVRATVSLSLRFFGGAIGFSIARPVDHAAGWVFVFSTDQRW